MDVEGAWRRKWERLKSRGRQGSHNKRICCGASGAYAPGPDDEEEIHQILSSDLMKEGEMDRTCGTCGVNEIRIQGLVGEPEEKRTPARSRHRCNVILKRDLNKYNCGRGLDYTG